MQRLKPRWPTAPDPPAALPGLQMGRRTPERRRDPRELSKPAGARWGLPGCGSPCPSSPARRGRPGGVRALESEAGAAGTAGERARRREGALARLLTRGSSRARFGPFVSVHRWPRSCEPPGGWEASLPRLSGQGAVGAGRGGASEAARHVLPAPRLARQDRARAALRPELFGAAERPRKVGRPEGQKWGRGFFNGRVGGQTPLSARSKGPPPRRRAEARGDAQVAGDFAKLPQESPARRGMGEEGGRGGVGRGGVG